MCTWCGGSIYALITKIVDRNGIYLNASYWQQMHVQYAMDQSFHAYVIIHSLNLYNIIAMVNTELCKSTERREFMRTVVLLQEWNRQLLRHFLASQSFSWPIFTLQMRWSWIFLQLHHRLSHNYLITERKDNIVAWDVTKRLPLILSPSDVLAIHSVEFKLMPEEGAHISKQ